MAINLDIDSATSVVDLSAKLEQFPTAVNGEMSSLESSFNQMTGDSGGNCDILGAVRGMVRKATAPFASAMKAAASAVEGAIKTAIVAVGDVIKSVQGVIQAAIGKVNEMIAYLATALDDVLEAAKAAIKPVIDAINSTIGAVSAFVGDVISTLTDVASEMFNEVRNLAVRACEGVTEAINTVSGEPSKSEAEFVEQNTAPMKNLLESKASSLGASSESLPTGEQSATQITNSFSYIDDFLNTGA